MVKKVWIATLAVCLLLVGCNNGGKDPEPNLEQPKTAIVCTNMTTGSTDPDIKQHDWSYTGELTYAQLATGLSEITGLDFNVAIEEVADGLTVAWQADSTLIANLDDREQKEEFFLFDTDSMRWFMLDSLWLTLTENFTVENVYYTDSQGQDLVLPELYPVGEFPVDLPYMGSAFFFAHADGKGELDDDNSDDMISQAAAEELVRPYLTEQEQEEMMLVGGAEEFVGDEPAVGVVAGYKSADGKNFTPVHYFAVTASGTVYYADPQQNDQWRALD